jgi:beta-xylosidase
MKLAMNKLALYLSIVLCSFCAQSLLSQHKTGSWGDQRNGTYINPVLNADYSDPDVIRVGEKYYMICSEFHFMGMTVQQSDDMVNWRIVGRIYDRLPGDAYNTMNRYAGGSWAPAIRFHNNRFYVYFCTPDEGLFMTSTEKPEGPWSPLLCVKQVVKWEDPCPFWDEDGQAYLGHSLYGAGPIIVHKMSTDGTKLLDDGVTVYRGPVAEGTKIFKWNGYYYMSIPEGGVASGWQTILRSKSIYGPYDRRIVLERGSTQVNGPHQGAMVDTPEGEWWFYHFQSAGATGRVLHLQPMRWDNDWPVVGVDYDRNGVGEPVHEWKKPAVGSVAPVSAPHSDDEFDSATLGLQWQWNHNPVDDKWSLASRQGWLSLSALQAPGLKDARNTLTQKIMGEQGVAVTLLDGRRMASGQKAGIACLSKEFTAIGLENKNGTFYLFFEATGKDTVFIESRKREVYLKICLDLKTKQSNCSYSFDNKMYLPIGSNFEPKWGYWKGARIALFSYNVLNERGTACFDFLHYNYDGPK